MMVEPVRKQLIVEAPVERAFRVFTEKVEVWWPAEHHIGKSPLKAIVIEPREGGGWFEIGEDDARCDWGKVLIWEPPRRLVLAWQLNAQWEFDPSLVTEVEVLFTAEGMRRTRVDFEHRNLERFGDAAKTVREGIDAPGGWPNILQRFVKAAAE